MEVRRSKNGKAALVLGGNLVIKYITVDAHGPILAIGERDDFYKQWPAKLATPPEEAVISYLGVAKRAHRHNAQVIDLLWEMFMNQCSNEMSLAQLLAWYNKLARSVGKTERKAFESKAAALAAIEKLDVAILQATPAQEKSQLETVRRSNMSDKDVAEKKPRGKGVGARANELLLEGKSVAEIIETIKAEIEGANPTPATIAWYRNKLRKDGKLPAVERKAK